MDKNLILLKYQTNFADNLSNFAYGKIIENNANCTCVYENDPILRTQFEEFMNYFNIKCNFISKSRASALENKRKYMDYSDINANRLKMSKIADIKMIQPSDTDKITDEIKNFLKFKNTDFIVNYDILEKITSTNSIGLYLSPEESIEVNYINKAVLRLNKYLKQPKLFIFSKKRYELDDIMTVEYLSDYSWQEEFYFLQNCKHKIIYGTNNSYSQGFWASVLSQYKSGYVIYSNKLKHTKKLNNWIAI